MTVRADQLTYAPTSNAWVNVHDYAGSADMLATNVWDVDLLAVVRHVMRDRDCTRIPVLVGAVVTNQTNQYGHNMFVEVEYDNSGHRAIYAAHVAGSVTNVTCYMD